MREVVMRDIFAAAACSTQIYKQYCFERALRDAIRYFEERETINQSTAKEVAK